jgi:hypothetical protein
LQVNLRNELPSQLPIRQPAQPPDACRSSLILSKLAPCGACWTKPGTVLALTPLEHLADIMKGLLVMVLYRRKIRYSIGKWILAAILFILAMTVTFANVEGFPLF